MLLKTIFEIFRTKTLSHTLLTSSATAVNGILGFLFFVLLARFLGPEDFGIFSVCVVTLTLLADIGDFGVNSSLINFVSKYIQTDKEKTFRFMKLAFETKLISGTLILLLGIVLAPLLANKIFLKPELTVPLQLTFLGIIFALLFNFITYSLQAAQKFKSWGILNILSNSIRLILALIMISFFTLSLNLTIMVYVASLFLGVAIGTFFLPVRFLTVKNELVESRDFFKFSKYVAVFIILAAISSRLDTFISARFLSKAEVGVYSVANQLSSVVPQLVFAIASVIAPKLKSYHDNFAAFNYLKKVQLLCLGIALLALFALPASYFMIPLIYGTEYYQSVGLFFILFLAQLLFLLAIPSNQALLYYFEKPNIYCISVFLQLVIVAFFGVILISRFGTYGAAYTVLLENAFNFIFPGVYVLYKFNKKIV